jgi:hypothetical protein
MSFEDEGSFQDVKDLGMLMDQHLLYFKRFIDDKRLKHTSGRWVIAADTGRE